MNKFNPFDNFMTFMKRDFTTFNMSNYHPTSTVLGRLLPIRTDLVLPSDYWKGNVNLACYTAALVAPAFTQIKAVTNAFYVSYPSIWKYWNQFISNRPSDAYLNSNNIAQYSGVYNEPTIPMHLIQMICKVALGYIQIEAVESEDSPFSSESYNIFFSPSKVLWREPYQLNYSHGIDSLRSYYYGDAPSTAGSDTYYKNTYYGETKIKFAANIPLECYEGAGFSDAMSFVIHQCKECYVNLKAFGIPCDLIARSRFSTYKDEYTSALPFMASSKIWQDYFRNNQVQGTELNYFEVNGSLCHIYDHSSSTTAFTPTTHEGINQFGWQLRLTDIPVGFQNTSYIQVYSELDSETHTQESCIVDYSRPISVLTGCGLRAFIMKSLAAGSVAILPNYYNGLLVAKYRNFEADYFNSAAIDPMQGRTSLAVPSTLEELRSVSKLEEFLERNTAARNFFDFLKSHFGTTAKSVTYGRSDLLGTSITPVNVSDVLQNSQSSDTSPQGNRSGVASAFGSNNLISKQFDEHGVIITYLSFVIDNQYFQGLPFIFDFHKDYLSYPWPEFANLGLEKIENKELFYGSYFSSGANSYSTSLGVRKSSGVIGNNIVPSGVDPDSTMALDDAFGYTPRYSKFKCKLDQLSGEFTTTLDFWNTYRDFSNTPMLSHDFVSYENAVFRSNLNRIFAVDDEISDKFYVNTYNDYSVSRCLPLVGNPQLD